MIKRLFAIGFIFACTSVAWAILAGVTSSRTYMADSGLKERVQSIWGMPQVQQPPTATWPESYTRKVETVEDGKKITKPVEDWAHRPLPVQASSIDVSLRLDPRQKGLLWYATYGVEFAATYVI